MIKKENRRNKWNITKDFLIREYIKNKKSLLLVANESGVPFETLYWYKKKFRIPSWPVSSLLFGKHNSLTTEFKKGSVPWNKGKQGVQTPWNKGKKLSKEYRRKISVATKRAMKNPDVRAKVVTGQFLKGASPWNKDKKGVYSGETILKIRAARLTQIYPKKNTTIEVILFTLLDELNVVYEKHKPIKTICQADAFVKPNFVIFADGDFWHCNPKFYPHAKSVIQVKNITRDRAADSKLIKDGYVVLRLWEDDLKNNLSACHQELSRCLK